MRNNEIVKRLKKIGFKQGRRATHITYWNCPCPEKNHVVGVGNHPSAECYFVNNILKDLGTHRKDFEKK